MKLKKLIKDLDILDIKISLETSINSVTSDSKKATEKSLFIAIRGEKRDGNSYIENAYQNGAICVITDDKLSFEKYKNTILVRNSRKALSFVWRNYYNDPAKSLKMIAITGTNGKTSCAYYLYNILKSAGKSCGLISTIETLINNKKIKRSGGSEVSDIASAMTTPDPKFLYSTLSEMKKEGVEYVVMEASSHSIEQEKFSAIWFLCGIFTNLSSEHLDFHKTMDNYFNAKLKLFDLCDIGVVNIDDEYGKLIKKLTQTPIYECSISEKTDFYSENIKMNETGCSYDFVCENDKISIETVIPGEYTIYNTMLSSSCAKLLGIDKESIVNGIKNTKHIKGRLEKIENTNIYIDYAHTPYAMKNIIKTIRLFAADKRITVLFGCGGDRDKKKRAIMGQIATQEADFAIITSDNSRSEDPVSIIKDILSDISEEKNYCIIPKREDAIKYAVKSMKENDILLLLGKGHEEYEIDKRGKHLFDERKIVKSVLKMK